MILGSDHKNHKRINLGVRQQTNNESDHKNHKGNNI